MSHRSTRLVQLVSNEVDRRIVEQLQSLLDEANRGEIVGLIVAAHYGADEYSYSGAGSFCSQPHLAAGALRNLSERFFSD